MLKLRCFFKALYGVCTTQARPLSLRVSHACSGQLHCALCERPAVDYHTLAQHMKDKHSYEAPERGPVTVSLSDLLQATR